MQGLGFERFRFPEQRNPRLIRIPPSLGETQKQERGSRMNTMKTILVGMIVAIILTGCILVPWRGGGRGGGEGGGRGGDRDGGRGGHGGEHGSSGQAPYSEEGHKVAGL